MSDLQTLPASGGGAPPAAPDDEAEIERRARLLGWKPQDEYRGPPDRWRPAAEFLAHGEEQLPVLRERLRRMDSRMTQVLNQNQEAIQTIGDLSERLRKADERGYRRAKAELEATRQEAVRSGDESTFARVDKELRELEAEAPKPVRQPPAAPPPQAPPPEVVAWAARNPWFHAHPDLREMATTLHVNLQASEPDLTLEQNLERVTESMAAAFPNRVRAVRTSRPAPPPDDLSPDDDEPLRRPPPVSAPRSAGGNGRAKPRSFEAMPKESQESFHRYAKMLSEKDMGKAKPLTKEEWAKDYWAQFEDA